jgi:hypothetical protein
MRSGSSSRLVLAFVSFLLLALVQNWPLPLHLSSALTGTPAGDTGVYVWNTWVFRHELVDHGTWPFRTATILPLGGPVDLTQENYTVVADLLTIPLQPLVGVVAAFNLVYLLNAALAGFGMYLLARRFTGRPAESWLAALLFACSPFLVTRGAGHFSLAAAAPLPLFVFFVDRTWHTARVRDALAVGATMAWAGFSDPYFGVYCVMVGIVYGSTKVLDVRVERVRRAPRGRLAIDLAITVLAAAIGGIHLFAGGELRAGGLRLPMHSLYTPVLLLTALVLARLALAWRVRAAWHWPPETRRILRMSGVAVAAASLLLAPELFGIGRLLVRGELVTVPVLWRSSAPGLDVLAFVLPNPNHPLAPHWIPAWFARQPARYVESVASLSWVAIATIVFAWRRASYRPERLWLVVTIGFAWLALGPFLIVAGVLTYIPTPWTGLRYLPIIGEARMPPRFAVVAVMGLAMLFASALVALGRRRPDRRGRWLAGIGLALAFELLAAPRPLFPADVPAVFRTIAADPRDRSVLSLPFGLRDGLVTAGGFSPASQFYQTVHGKTIVGGYLSRIPRRSWAVYRAQPVVTALIDLSDGKVLADEARRAAAASAGDFVRRTKLGYVVEDTRTTSDDLRQFAIATLHLTLLSASGPYRLYVIAD